MNKDTKIGKIISKEEKEKKETWSQEKRVGDSMERINVEKLDNEGFLIILTKEWYDSKGRWKSRNLKLFSKHNPLDEDNDDPISKVYDFLKGNVKD